MSDQNMSDRNLSGPSSQTAAPPSLTPPPVTLTLAELFLGFAKISVSGFGMILPWARRILVEDRKWMTAEEFNETFSFANFLPGPNVVNLSVVFGARMRGAPGAIVSVAGLLGPPALMAAFLGFLYAQYGDIDVLRRMLTGVAAAAIGLMIAVVAKMAAPLFRKLKSPAPVILVVTFVAIAILRLPMIQTVLVLVPLSIAVSYWWERR